MTTDMDNGAYFLSESQYLEISDYLDEHPKTKFQKIADILSKKWGFRVSVEAVRFDVKCERNCKKSLIRLITIKIR